MTAPKLTQEDIKQIQKFLEKGHSPKKLAKKYGVHVSVIYRRAKHPYQAKYVPVEIKNNIIKKINEGYSKAEATQMYNVPVNTVLGFTKGMPGHKSEGNHILRKNGIELLKRLMSNGYLISDFVLATARRLQHHFPMIMSARYKDKTFFYLKGREEETIEAFFREKPDRVISYRAIEEMAYLLGVKVSNMDQRKLLERYKRKHDDYWRSRRLIQRRMEEFDPDCIFPYKKEQVEPSFRLFPKLE